MSTTVYLRNKPKSLISSQALQRRPISITASSQAPSSSAARAPAAESVEPEPDSATSQPPKTLPYYSLFPQTLPHGPPPSGPFDIDVRALRREFLTLQAASHPDFHHHASTTASSSSNSSTSSHSAARARAEATSAHINAAYRTLADPLTRGQYLLREQHGIDLAGDESTGAGNVEQEVLLAVMEAREEIESAKSEEELQELRKMNEERLEETVRRLGEAFERGDVEMAKREGVRLRYWRNVRESIDAWEEGGKVMH